jgi:hypothetical protein
MDAGGILPRLLRGRPVELRFRASHFPFTEPSAEVDIRYSNVGGQLRIGEGDKWMEILGSGMVHPKVLAAAGVDPTQWQGFAFGMGIDRIAMLKYGIPDLRAFFEADLRWLRHYGFSRAGHAAMEPIGVVGLITPWNWPMNQIALKAIPAMLAGCTCVLKPSEESPLNAMLFAEFCHDAGLPPGVFNLVNGDGRGRRHAAFHHPDVEMISFTGSTRAGRAISKAAAETLKRVTLELGGKGANLIFADADDKAVNAACGMMEQHRPVLQRAQRGCWWSAGL